MYSYGFDATDSTYDDCLSVPSYLQGDPYREDDHVTRGVTLDFDLGYCVPPSLGSLSKNDEFLEHGPQKACDMEGSRVGMAERVHVQEFQEDDVPRDAPRDLFFSFEATTVLIPVSMVAPVKLGNTIIQCLTSALHAEITKVNTSKFSIRATVFDKGKSCLLKIRVYRQPANYAIEFQRCSGDSSTFRSSYQKASVYLIACTGGFPEDNSSSPRQEPWVASELGLPPHFEQIAPSLFEPLVEMACSQELCIQAEAAVAFAVALEEPHIATQVCALPEVVSCLTSLMQSSHVEVAVPAARALQLLTLCPQPQTRCPELSNLSIMGCALQHSHQLVRKMRSWR